MTTTTMAKEQAPKRAERATRAAHRSGEALVFAAAISLVVGLGAIVAFPSMRPAARSAVALLFGALATVNGMLHVKHIADQGAVGSDLTGVLAAAAGAVLVGLDRDPVAPPRRGSGEPAPALDLPRPRRPARAARPPLRGRAHEHRAHRDARVPRGDRRPAQRRLPRGGVRGRGRGRALRLVPPDAQRRHILVVHGGGSDRTGSVAHAELLARHGYGVLLHDARGRGKSEGVQNSWGWGWGEDVAGALAFLKSREEVDPERIGALGLSTGADVLVEAAGQRTDLKAVVDDGTAAGSFDDHRRVLGLNPLTPLSAVNFATVRVLSGSTPGPVLEDMVKRVTSPLLLVAAGPAEKPRGEAYDRAAGDRPVDLWYLPDVGHTAAIREAAPEYEQRVTTFFDGALGDR